MFVEVSFVTMLGQAYATCGFNVIHTQFYCGHGRMVVGFTTTWAISAYHH